jgi:hypothetical protein
MFYMLLSIQKLSIERNKMANIHIKGRSLWHNALNRLVRNKAALISFIGSSGFTMGDS